MQQTLSLSHILKKWLTVIKQFHEIGTIPIVLIGNKIDLKDERIVDNEDAIELAHLNRMKYFETSAKTTQGVEEAFLSLIHPLYLCNNRNGKQKLGNVIIRKIILSQNKEQKRNFKSISNHNKELTTKGLKNLISGIENEKDYENLYLKIKEIEIYIEEMHPIKCNINYKSLFPLLFKKIGMIKDMIIKYKTYANVYLQLMIVFPMN